MTETELPIANDTGLMHALKVLWRRRLIFAACVLLGVAAAALLAHQEAPSYQATAQVLLARQDVGLAATGTSQLPYNDQQETIISETEATIADSPPVIARTVTSGTGGLQAQNAFRQRSSVRVLPGTDILRFSVSARTGPAAERDVNTWVTSYRAYRQQLSASLIDQALDGTLANLRHASPSSALGDGLKSAAARLDALRAMGSSDASVVASARSANQTAPRPTRDIVLGLVAGLLFGITAAFVANAVDPRERDISVVAQALGATVVSELPRRSRRPDSRAGVEVADAPQGDYAESIRTLRGRVTVALDAVGGQSLLIAGTPGDRGERPGAELAYAYAQIGHRVLLIDADLREQAASRGFRLAGRPGLVEIVVGDADVESASVPIDVRGAIEGCDVRGSLAVVPVGTVANPAPDLLESVAFKRFLGSLLPVRDRPRDGAYDLVIVDGGELPPSTLASLATHVDGVVLVVARGLSHRQLRPVRQALGGVEVVAVVDAPRARASRRRLVAGRWRAVRSDAAAADARDGRMTKPGPETTCPEHTCDTPACVNIAHLRRGHPEPTAPHELRVTSGEAC